MKKQVKLNSQQTEKSNLQERTFYQCYCAKNYQSYSALYLHVKNKHHHNLSFKSFRRKRTSWSGSIKNVILQFDEEIGDMMKAQPLSLKLRERPKKVCLKQSDNEEEIKKKREKALKEQEIKLEQQIQNDSNEEETIYNVFHIYINLGETVEVQTFRKQLLDRLMFFIDRNYSRLINQAELSERYCMIKNCSEVPLFMDQFFKKQCRTSPLIHIEAYELIRLTQWLNQKYINKRVKVKKEDDPTKVLVKIEEGEKVKIEKIESNQQSSK